MVDIVPGVCPKCRGDDQFEEEQVDPCAGPVKKEYVEPGQQ